MSNQLRRNPDTGAIEREVVSYEVVELAQVEAEVSEREASLEQILADKRAALETSLEQDPEVVAARGAVSEAKSELEACQALVAESGDSAEAEGVASEGENGDEAEPVGDASADAGAVEVPVTVEGTDDLDEY